MPNLPFKNKLTAAHLKLWLTTINTKNNKWKYNLSAVRLLFQEQRNFYQLSSKTKIAFHEQKINTLGDSEEDILHSEKKIIQLQKNFRNAIKKMKEKGQI